MAAQQAYLSLPSSAVGTTTNVHVTQVNAVPPLSKSEEKFARLADNYEVAVEDALDSIGYLEAMTVQIQNEEVLEAARTSPKLAAAIQVAVDKMDRLPTGLAYPLARIQQRLRKDAPSLPIVPVPRRIPIIDVINREFAAVKARAFDLMAELLSVATLFYTAGFTGGSPLGLEPVHLMFCGPAGQGKSLLAECILELFRRMSFTVMTKGPDDRFFDDVLKSLGSAPLHVLALEELFSADNKKDGSLLLSLISSAPWTPFVANVDLKGTILSPMLVVSTTNFPYPKGTGIDAGALNRRVHLRVFIAGGRCYVNGKMVSLFSLVQMVTKRLVSNLNQAKSFTEVTLNDGWDPRCVGYQAPPNFSAYQPEDPWGYQAEMSGGIIPPVENAKVRRQRVRARKNQAAAVPSEPLEVETASQTISDL